MSLVPLMDVESEPERLVIVAMLEAHDIPCFVHNDGFGGLYPGLQINLYNTRRIMVPEEDLDDAHELLASYRAAPEETPAARLDWIDGLRCLAEALLGGWLVPRPRARQVMTKDTPERPQ
ncbi:MAG: DUF2007 domain-containing protein [Gammaproteobacteria bacterium]